MSYASDQLIHALERENEWLRSELDAAVAERNALRERENIYRQQVSHCEDMSAQILGLQMLCVDMYCRFVQEFGDEDAMGKFSRRMREQGGIDW